MKRILLLFTLAASLATAQEKVSERTALTGASVDLTNDILPIVDISAGTSGSKKITIAEFWKALGGTNVSTTELSYLDGVTSAIQTQINARELALGNPGTNGYVLSSTTGGTRSWIAPATGNISSGPVTATGGVSSIANGAISNAMLANGAVANLSGTNSGNETATTLSNTLAPGLFDDFRDSSRYAPGATITNNVSQPLIGPDKYWLNLSGSPAPTVANGGYGTTGNGIYYLGSTVPTTAGKMSLGFRFTGELSPAGAAGTGFNNTFNVSFSQNPMQTPSTGAIITSGVVHANMDRGGVAGVGYYTDASMVRSLTFASGNTSVTLASGTTTGLTAGLYVLSENVPVGATIASITDSTHFVLSAAATASTTQSVGFSSEGTRFVCIEGTWDGARYTWNNNSSPVTAHNREYAFLTQVDGNIVTYTMAGVGRVRFTEPHLSAKVGAVKTHWWFEGVRDATFSTMDRLNCVWGGPSTWMDTHPNYGGFVGGNIPSLAGGGPHYLPGTLNLFPFNKGSRLTADALPSASFNVVAGGFGTTTTGSYAKAKGGLFWADQAYVANVGSTNASASVWGYASMNVNTGLSSGTLSSSAGAETTLKAFQQTTSTLAGDSESYTLYGRLVGTNAKRIRVVQNTYGSVYFDSDVSGAPLTSLTGAFTIKVERGASSANSHIVYTTLTVNGLAPMVQALSVNLGNIYQNIEFKTTTTDAGAVIIDWANRTHEKGSVQ